MLIDVNADDIRLVRHSSLNRGGVDAAAAGEDDLGALGVPAVHLGGDVGIAVELAAVGVLDLDGGAHLNRSGVRALHEAVAVALHRRNGHAAQEAQLGVAVLHSSVARAVAGLLLAEHGAVEVVLRVGAQVARRHVDGDELDLRIHVLHGSSSLAEQEARHDDDLRAVGHSLVDGVEALIGAVSGGLIVLIAEALRGSESLNALPAGLVEGLVVDGGHVGDQRHVGSQRGRGGQRQHSGQHEQHGKQFLHDTFLLES